MISPQKLKTTITFTHFYHTSVIEFKVFSLFKVCKHYCKDSLTLFEFSTPVLRTELASFVFLSSKNYNKLFKYAQTSLFIELHSCCGLLISLLVLNSSEKITSTKLLHTVWHYLYFLTISNGKNYSCLCMMYKK